MGTPSEQLNRQGQRPKPSYTSKYVILGHFGDGSYGPYPGDAGLIIPKLLGFRNDATLLRIKYIEEYKGKEQFECGGCGNKFRSMEDRDFHFKKRHGERRGPVVKNLEDLTDAQKEALKEEIANDYNTNPMDFHVPDPTDSIAAAEEKRDNERAPLHLDKTKASRK